MAPPPRAATIAPAASTIHDNFSPLPPEAPLLDSSSTNSVGATVGAGVAVGDAVGDDVEVDVEWLDEDDETKPARGWHVRARSWRVI